MLTLWCAFVFSYDLLTVFNLHLVQGSSDGSTVEVSGSRVEVSGAREVSPDALPDPRPQNPPSGSRVEVSGAREESSDAESDAPPQDSPSD